jgi:fatty-acyl-CoA synthase
MGWIGDVTTRLRSDWTYATGMARILRHLDPVVKDRHRTWPAELARIAARRPDRPALLSDAESFTYAALDARADRWARWALSVGLAKGETVALIMENRPEYVAVWTGITRAGGVVALVNTAQTGTSLAHSIDVAAARHVIVSAAFNEAFASALPHLVSAPRIWSHGPGPYEPVEPVLAALPPGPPSADALPEITTDDRCLLIFTSGTTGLPKAANVNHYRIHAMIRVFAAALRVRPDDRMYVALPLYHTSGGVLAVCTMMSAGASAAIAPRFSARAFWDDVVRFDCTMSQYIGEVCRYLLAAPPNPKERAHRLRIVSGNGLRPEVWTAFTDRFGIPRVFEWYASTEGNAVLLNLDGRVGSVGRIPAWARGRLPTRLIRVDPDDGTVLRAPDGRCIEAADGEAGELVAEILRDPRRPGQRFEGYTDAGAGRSKVLEGVFRPGDRWFRTGDLMRRDRLGYFNFVDRLGDTFRWKGENVSTTEVAGVLGTVPGVVATAVYGVAVPGYDGRAGMAVIEVDSAAPPDLDVLARRLGEALAAYARPLFLRLTERLDTTGTFKPRKADLVADGFDPARVRDPLFLLDPRSGRYVPLRADLHAAVVAGTIRL